MAESNNLNRTVNRIFTDIASVVSSGRILVKPELTTDDIKFARLTGTSTGTVTYEVASTVGLWELLDVRAHFSAVGAAGTLDVVLDSGSSTPYDLKFISEALTTVTDLFWQPERPIVLNADDHLDITWASPTTGSSVTFGFEAAYKLL